MKINLETQSPLYSDLVNNKQIFDECFDESELSKFDYKDNTNYSHYEHIDDFLKRDFDDDDLDRSYVIQVPIDYIWSSEKTKGGFDRPIVLMLVIEVDKTKIRSLPQHYALDEKTL